MRGCTNLIAQLSDYLPDRRKCRGKLRDHTVIWIAKDRKGSFQYDIDAGCRLDFQSFLLADFLSNGLKQSLSILDGVTEVCGHMRLDTFSVDGQLRPSTVLRNDPF